MAFNGNYIKYICSFAGPWKLSEKEKKTELDHYSGLNGNYVIYSLCNLICNIQAFAKQWNQSSLLFDLWWNTQPVMERAKLKGTV